MTKFNFTVVALKNLKRKPFRTGVLVFAISLLVSLIIFSLSFIASVSSSIKKASDRLGADLIVVPIGARGYAEAFLLESKKAEFYMNKNLIDRVKKIEGIEALTYQIYLSTIGGVCCDVEATRIIAFDQESDFIVKPWLKKAIGRGLNKGEAIAGYETNFNLGVELLDLETTIFHNKFKVVGVLEKTGTALDNALVMTEENIKDIVGSGKSPINEGQISLIFTKVKKGFDPYEVGRTVEGNIVEVDVVARSDMGKEILGTLKDINKIFLLSIVLSSILAVFLVWAIFSAIANERSREVGIMRAVGANESHIVKLFIIEVFFIGLAGSLIGLAVGTSVSLSLARGFKLLKNISASLTVLQQAEIAVAGLLIGIIICIAGALMPINRIKKLEPLLAIKEE
ncbi:MAG: FtsX-like permease family protein [Nitrospiraceae bacterium]|nr:MAG: FtsX-like permease family protein [Nitrospiraceae bacterium]